MWEGKKYIEYYDCGSVFREVWHKNEGDVVDSNWHREDGPAVKRYDRAGNLVYEVYCVDGRYCREDGPAYIEYDTQGNVRYEEYWWEKRQVTKNEWLKKTSKLGKGLY